MPTMHFDNGNKLRAVGRGTYHGGAPFTHGSVTIVDDVALELVPVLRAAILAACEATPISFRSMNIGGWRSNEELFHWKAETGVPALAEALATRLEVAPSALVGWAVVNRRGSFHKRHNHRSTRSGVFYVDAGGPRSSPTCFELARDGDRVTDQLTVAPHPGRLVHFPGDTWHWVPKYDDLEPRISIAFDVR